MEDIAIFRINYKSDFVLTLNSDAGWMTPFCIKFWTGVPSQAYFASYDGTTYTHCAPVAGEPTKLLVQFDDHHLPIGNLQFQIAYHFTVADFPTSVEDEVLNQASVIIEVDDAPAQVMLDLNGETAPEIQFTLPAYTNEQQRIANEEQRIAAETQRISNEEARIAAETVRQQNEAQRINQEQARVNEYASLKADAAAATDAANDAATLAQQKAEYAQQQGGYAKEQGDYAKDQGDYAKEQGDTALADHQRAEADHGIAVDDHTQAGNDHTRAESDHGIAVDDHTQAGNDHTRAESDHGIAADDHTRAESDHGIAVDDHTQAGNDHTRAEADHGIAVDDHTQAGNDHTRAESDHTQAGNDHTRAESDHTQAGNDHTQAGNDHTRAESDHTRAESDHAAVEVYVDSLGVFDLSKHNAVGGVLATYANLDAALTALNALESKYKYGGMSFKFVQSSDNKYVQFRLKGESFNTTTSNWINSEEELEEIVRPSTRFIDTVIDENFPNTEEFTTNYVGSASGVYFVLTEDNIYKSVVFKADRDMQVYCDASDNLYYSIVIGKNASDGWETGNNQIYKTCTSTVRYRKSENNLPTADNPLTIYAGDTVAISVRTADVYPPHLYISSEELMLTDKVLLNEKQIQQVLDEAGNGKTGKVEYIGSSGVDDSTEHLNIYLPTFNGYIKYEFVHSVRIDKNCDVWRIAYTYAVDNVLSNPIPLTTTGEWELAVSLEGRADFSGGLAHGDEVKTNIKFLVDGKEVTLSSLASLTEFNNLRVVQYSTLYDPNDSTTIIGYHGSEHIWIPNDSNHLKIKQSLKWVNPQTLSSCYMAMFPVAKSVTDTFYDDVDFDVKAISNLPIIQYKAKELDLFKNSQNVFTRFGVSKYIDDIAGGNYALIHDNGSSTYNKCYFVICQTGSVQSGELWKTETYYNIEIAN